MKLKSLTAFYRFVLSVTCTAFIGASLLADRNDGVFLIALTGCMRAI